VQTLISAWCDLPIDREIYFDLFDQSSPVIIGNRIEQFLSKTQFEDVLQFVTLPSVQLEQKVVASRSIMAKRAPKPDQKGRNDMVFFFDFLRRKGVRRVIHVLVEDTQYPFHSDEAIEKALGGLKVEIWDWKKPDLCIDTILIAAADVREVYLYWSGNNAILRSWSEPGGLALLKKLEKVHLQAEPVSYCPMNSLITQMAYSRAK
jgi:hypothetical protein